MGREDPGRNERSVEALSFALLGNGPLGFLRCTVSMINFVDIEDPKHDGIVDHNQRSSQAQRFHVDQKSDPLGILLFFLVP